jgi:hypothetical protein
MEYANQEFQYGGESSAQSPSQSTGTRRTDYSRGRSYKALRRKARRRSTSHTPAPGIAARRGKRWNW